MVYALQTYNFLRDDTGLQQQLMELINNNDVS